MTHDSSSDELSEEQRRTVFREELAATSTGGRRSLSPRIPPRFVWGVAAAFALLGLGGAVLDHYLGNGGSPTAPTTGAPRSTTTTPTITTLPRSTAAFIGLRDIASARAPALSLTDQSGHAWRLASEQGRVVLVTFYDVNCTDICPVLGRELRDALALLHARGVTVDVAIVNTNPRDVARRPAPAALSTPGLSRRPDVQFLTGPLSQLNAVWSSYGISVRVGAKANEIAHNNVLYFIDPRGRLRALATPFANESRRAVFTLSTADIERFAQGVAAEAGSLAR